MKRRVSGAITIGLVMAVASLPAGAQYHTYPQIEAELLAAQTNYPSLCRRDYLGPTVQGRSMWALCISDNVNTEEDEPEFRYISTMHGDEIMGIEMCLNLIDYLTTNYGSDPRVTNIVDSVELWIVPCMNPDGYVGGSRYNANFVDLNRDFPDVFTSPSNTTAGREPETANIMNWGFGRSFTLAANYHGGALVVSYPYDGNASQQDVYTPTPDDDLIVWMSEEYSQYNLPMWNSATFYHGITNGADWYVIYGGMQDWSYRYMGTNEVTIEVSVDKSPPASQIPQFWSENRESMLAYIETCLIGVRGLVTDAVTGAPLPATITVAGRNHDVYTDPDVGDYHRMLLPGTYDVTFAAAGYAPITLTDVVVNPGPATRLDIPLGAPVQVVSPNGGEQVTVGVETTVTWTGSPLHSFHVQYTANYGQFSTVTDDFERDSLGPDYTTGGDWIWSILPGVYRSPTRAARAGPITHNEQSWMTRTASGGSLSFWYRVSSESGWDWFNFYIDGARQLHKSGNVSWTQYSTTLSAGTHELKWEYIKDATNSSGSDTVWIDDLQLMEDTSTWTDIVAMTAPGATSAPWTPTVTGPDHKVRVRTYYGAGLYSSWDESDSVFTVTDAGCVAGDVSEDSQLTVADDVPIFVDLLVGTVGGNPYQQCAADTNGDGDIDGDDIQGFVELFIP